MRALLQTMTAALLVVSLPTAAAAQDVQTPDQSLLQDAVEYARAHAISTEDGIRFLRAEQDSVAATDAIATEFRDRLAGISVEQDPAPRFVVLLTGNVPVPPRTLEVSGETISVIFRTGARATRAQIVTTLRASQSALRRALPNARGSGLDQRTGELVLLVTSADAARLGAPAIRTQAEAITGVPVSVRLSDGSQIDMAIAGGARVVGANDDGRRAACTSGFVVTDGIRDAIATAAHCPNTLLYLDPAGGQQPLDYVGQWGWSYQDVQVNATPQALRPLFYSDPKSDALRRLTSWRNRTSLRAGDFVCHYGETTGYSCAKVLLTDFAPPGDLCGGPCDPMWVTVAGPNCKSGDSGGPVFLGTTAIGIFKGGSGTASPRCNFYYFMSTDFLPRGWTLRTTEPAVAPGASQ
jgi:hypothetical protein